MIRGICGLRPGVEGPVGEYPGEISSSTVPGAQPRRVFGNGHGLPSKEAGVMLSADWMGRNLNRRVETLVEAMNDATVKAQIRSSQIVGGEALADEAQSWVLQPDGKLLRELPEGKRPVLLPPVLRGEPSLSGRGWARGEGRPELP